MPQHAGGRREAGHVNTPGGGRSVSGNRYFLAADITEVTLGKSQNLRHLAVSNQ
jgi:hypothetical protein